MSTFTMKKHWHDKRNYEKNHLQVNHPCWALILRITQIYVWKYHIVTLIYCGRGQLRRNMSVLTVDFLINDQQESRKRRQRKMLHVEATFRIIRQGALFRGGSKTVWSLQMMNSRGPKIWRQSWRKITTLLPVLNLGERPCMVECDETVERSPSEESADEFYWPVHTLACWRKWVETLFRRVNSHSFTEFFPHSSSNALFSNIGLFHHKAS